MGSDAIDWGTGLHRPRPVSLAARRRLTGSPDRRAKLDLPTSFTVPWEWIQANASPPIRYRTAREILPPDAQDPDLIASLREEVVTYPPALAIAKKQNAQGVWGSNLLGLQALKAERLRDVGTVAQYRRLLQHGWGQEERPMRLAERLLFRLLSRDDDPALLFEHKQPGAKDPEYASRTRALGREAAACALAEAGYGDDPRVRGAAQRIVSEISLFLRSESAEKPIVRLKGRNTLRPDAHPPTVFSVSMIAHMQSLQRERASLIERLRTFLMEPAPKRQYVIPAGGRTLKPRFTLLGDPVQATAAGLPADLPLALHWIELLARLGAVETSPTAQRVLARLFKDCDETGVWRPKGRRGLPKGASKLSYHTFPLEPPRASGEARFADVTFRLALIARLAGWSLAIA